MPSRAIGIVAAGAVLAISIYLKGNSQYDTHIDAYYVVNLIIISATVMVALALSMIISYASKRKAATRDTGASDLPNRRDHYRISYEADQRPLLRIKAPSLELTGEHEFDVLDISEQGIRFLNDQNVHFSDAVHGELVFIDGETVMIEGQIVRETGAQLSLKLSTPIPFKSIIKEQRRIITDQQYQDKYNDQSSDEDRPT